MPAHLGLLPLPPDSPELNLLGLDPRIELVGQDLRRRDLADRVFADLNEVVDACCRAWNRLVADPGRLTALTDFAWARPTPTTS